jgi:hypothetical protein
MSLFRRNRSVNYVLVSKLNGSTMTTYQMMSQYQKDFGKVSTYVVVMNLLDHLCKMNIQSMFQIVVVYSYDT